MSASPARHRRSLRARMVLNGAAGLVVILGGVAALLTLSGRMSTRLSDAVDSWAEEQLIADRIGRAVIRQILIAPSIQPTVPGANREDFRAAGQIVYAQLREYLRRDLTLEERLQLERVREAHEHLEVAAARTASLAGRGEVAAAGDAYATMTQDGFELLDALDGLLRMREVHLERVRTTQQRVFRTMHVLGVVFGAIVLVGAIVLGSFLMRRVDRPLSELATAAQRMERGHLDVRVSEARDAEFAAVAASFNRMADSLTEALGAARRSEASFRHLFTNNPLPMWVYDRETLAFLEVNDAAVDHYGYTRDEFLAMNLKDIRPVEDVERLLEIVGHERPTLQESGEWRHRLKDGRLIDADITSHLLTFDGRSAALVVARDVSETKRMTHALYEREHRLSSIYNTAADVIFHLTVEGEGVYRFTSVNPAFQRVTGLDAEQVVGKRVDEVIPEPSLTMVLERYGMAIRERRIVRWEETSSYPSGTLTGEVSVAPVFDEVGRCTHLVGAVHDVTRRKEAEDELRASEERYRTFVEHASYGIYRSTLEGRFLAVNPALVRMLGYESAQKLMRTSAVELYGDPEMQSNFVSRYRDADRIGDVEVEWRRKDGRPITVQLRGRAVRDGHGAFQYFEMFAEDVTEQRAVEAQLRQSQKMDAVGQLTGGIAHDFNNLLSVILTNARFAMDQLPESDPALEDLREVHAAGERAAELTHQLLAFSRKQILEPKVTNLNGIFDGIEGMLRRLIGEHIEIEVRRAERLANVMADPGQLEQVIVNLALNARDAMPNGGKLTFETANVEVDEAYVERHVAVTPGGYVRLAVTDTGIGMSAETRERIFEPFFTTKEKGKGTGLGLATVFGIVKQSGGSIWVYSEPGEGTTFKVYLPWVRVETADAGAAPAVKGAIGDETILLVEDEDAVRRAAARILDRAGYAVLTAGGGAEALRLCEEHEGTIDLLLTDVVMPRMSGRELERQAKQLNPNLKVLFMSGYADDAIVHHGALDPGTQFIGKPFSVAQLRRKVREVLDGG